jgi:hypothetical protein
MRSGQLVPYGPYRSWHVVFWNPPLGSWTDSSHSSPHRAHDAAFADRLLEAAKAGYRFVRDRPAEDSDGPTCPAMRQDGNRTAGRDVRMYAAAGLLLATGEPGFRVDFNATYQPLQNDPSYQRSNIYAALFYLHASAGDPGRQRAPLTWWGRITSFSKATTRRMRTVITRTGTRST